MRLTRKKIRQLIKEAYTRQQLRQRDSTIKTYIKENYNVRDIFDSLSAYHGTGDFFDAAHQESYRIAKEVQASGVFLYTDPHRLIKMVAKILLVELFALHRKWLDEQEY